MESSVYSISPEVNGSFILTEHCSCHLDKSSILSLNNSILLGSVCGRELMSNTIFVEKVLNMSIFELSAIVASDVLNAHIIFILSFLGESFEYVLGACLVFEKEYPSIAREIINNN
jgi:hypothetical protein